MGGVILNLHIYIFKRYMAAWFFKISKLGNIVKKLENYCCSMLNAFSLVKQISIETIEIKKMFYAPFTIHDTEKIWKARGNCCWKVRQIGSLWFCGKKANIKDFFVCPLHTGTKFQKNVFIFYLFFFWNIAINLLE